MSGVGRPLVVETTVFFSGAVVMVLELVGSRLLAPYFGNSIFVWTSLIGVMLGFMALGYSLGGRLADRTLSGSVLFWILACASLSVSVIEFVDTVLLTSLADVSSLRTGAVIASLMLFAVPSTLLGMVSPYCIRLKMHALADSGATVGNLYALSTLGSIVGTFAAGFWLIAAIGSHAIIALLAAVPAVLAVLFIRPVTAKRTAGIVLVFAVLSAAALFAGSPAFFDTQYDRYQVERGTDTASSRRIVALSRNYNSIESAVYGDDGTPYVFDYYAYYDLALKLAPKVDHTLIVGGGMFVYPRLQLQEYPASRADVVEIDPKLVQVARSQFSLHDDPRMHIVVEDGRTYLDRAHDSYDVIILDAFKSADAVPYQLTTYETAQRCSALLGEHGLVAMNLISSLSGPGSRFTWSEYATLKAVFPQVALFAVQDPDSPGEVQNISIVAAKDPSADLAAAVRRVAPGLAPHEVTATRLPAGTRVLTDDFAPVDQYVAGIAGT